MMGNYVETLTAMVKAAGQDLIDRAEDLVGQGKLLGEFNLYITFDRDNGCIPQIEVNKKYLCKRALHELYPEVYGDDKD